MRSRAVSLPLACCAAMRASPPPSRARARRASKRASISFIAAPPWRANGLERGIAWRAAPRNGRLCDTGGSWGARAYTPATTFAAASISRQRAGRRPIASSSSPHWAIWKSSSTWARARRSGAQPRRARPSSANQPPTRSASSSRAAPASANGSSKASSAAPHGGERGFRLARHGRCPRQERTARRAPRPPSRARDRTPPPAAATSSSGALGAIADEVGCRRRRRSRRAFRRSRRRRRRSPNWRARHRHRRQDRSSRPAPPIRWRPARRARGSDRPAPACPACVRAAPVEAQREAAGLRLADARLLVEALARRRRACWPARRASDRRRSPHSSGASSIGSRVAGVEAEHVEAFLHMFGAAARRRRSGRRADAAASAGAPADAVWARGRAARRAADRRGRDRWRRDGCIWGRR